MHENPSGFTLFSDLHFYLARGLARRKFCAMSGTHTSVRGAFFTTLS